MRSEFLSQLARLAPELSAPVHGPKNHDRRQYTVSPLLNLIGEPEGHEYELYPGDHYQFRITGYSSTAVQGLLLLCDSVEDWFINSESGRVWFKVQWYVDGVRLARTKSWNQLAEEASCDTTADLTFMTPTCFTSGRAELDGEARRHKWTIMQPLPIAERVFGSWYDTLVAALPSTSDHTDSDAPSAYERLVTACPLLREEIKIPRTWFRDRIGINQHELRTVSVKFSKEDKMPKPGFIGHVQYHFNPNLAAEELKLLNLLVDFSYYCGAGEETTNGMGQVIRRTAKNTRFKQNRNRTSRA